MRYVDTIGKVECVGRWQAMKKLIVHYGMHKTGSSSIQHSFYSGLLADEIHYISFGAANSSGALSRAFQPGRLVADIEAGDLSVRSARILESLESQLGNLPSTSVALLSAEALCTFSEQELIDFYCCVCTYVSEVELVGYVRSPVGYVSSAYQQRLKVAVSRFPGNNLVPDYKERFEKLERVFGASNVKYWPFVPRSFPGGCVVRDFCSRLGSDPGPQAIVRVNDSLSANAVALLYADRAVSGPRSRAIRDRQSERRFLRWLAELRGPKLKISPIALDAQLQNHRDGIEWIEKRVGSKFEDEGGGSNCRHVSCLDELLSLDHEGVEQVSRFLDCRLNPADYSRCSVDNLAKLAGQVRRILDERRG